MKMRVRVEGVERLKAALGEIKRGVVSAEAIDRLSNGLKERITERADTIGTALVKGGER